MLNWREITEQYDREFMILGEAECEAMHSRGCDRKEIAEPFRVKGSIVLRSRAELCSSSATFRGLT